MTMEVDEVEAVLEKIWDLHDKLSDAIHSVSRAHFLKSVEGPGRCGAKHSPDDEKKVPAAGFVFVKDFGAGFGDDALREAKSLNAIRTALENLEDQLEFFHTVHIQQRAERDAAIARLEQSRIILAMRLAEHHGKKYKVIEEALAFVGDVGEANLFVSRDTQFNTATGLSGQNSPTGQGNKCKLLIKLLVSSLSFARKSFGLDNVGGLLGNAALVGITMFAMIHFNNSSRKEPLLKHGGDNYNSTANRSRIRKGVTSSSRGTSSRQLDVLLARG
ncbi:hypothetical protein MLD38_015690 [Melastoma candidum]|uniref:Uncharacterized protein n=1 Tax=Melastoma candidum TaxID=119954 RepID=A0ACB9RKM0_9MYRT|nr:hypothetical protein MLD38_015690 [Melastoma candidum]